VEIETETVYNKVRVDGEVVRSEVVEQRECKEKGGVKHN